ncbi:MAG: transcription termination/antitermination protein NusA [Candidatus Sungbacteria bacterium]|uniref:Transcription termination/antitermination protein NusA n=1 Tax=Candidatus Sungiibacteriota bacterium TaxID=2750080 RepID=A0A932YW41_9BACT|nr:transcription termination/antitermination protein NusA [Candidatus Sungbacteria bacterium]
MDLKTFGQAIRELAEEKGVDEAKVIETIELAIAAAYKKDYGKKGQLIQASFNPQTGELTFAQVKLVVDESMIKSEEEIAAEEEARAAAPPPMPGSPRWSSGEAGERRRRESEEEHEALPAGGAQKGEAEIRKIRFNPERHIMLDEARAIKPDAARGEELEFALEAKQEFGRIASQTAKQVIIQRIREAEREATFAEFKDKEGEIVSGVVQRIEGRNVFVDLGRGAAILPADEQIPRERYNIGERMKALLLYVEREARGPGLFLTRSHPRFLKKLFELEVPEIPSGAVEIKTIAREAGSRSKVAVASNDPAIDPVGSMVGQRGVRVSTVMNEIAGEKIDIIEWSDDQARFIANALSPAKVLDVTVIPERHDARVMVPDDQLSLAIGKGGQNVRLAAKLTGWKIDVRSAASERQAAPPEPEIEAESGQAQEMTIAPAPAPPAEPAADGSSNTEPEKPRQKRVLKKKTDAVEGGVGEAEPQTA